MKNNKLMEVLKKLALKNQLKTLQVGVYLKRMTYYLPGWDKFKMGKIYFPFLCYIAISCQDNEEINIEENFNISKKGRIEIKLNPNGLAISNYQVREKKDDLEIIRSNYGYKSISIYSIEKQKEIKEVKLNMNNLMPYFEKGSGITGFYLKGEDSLYIMNYYSDLLLINSQTGEYTANYNLPTKDSNNDIKIDNRYPFYIIGNEVIYTKYQRNFEDNIFYKINLINGEKDSFSKYPELYRKNENLLEGGWYDYLSHVMINDSTMIYGHPISHDLRILNIKSKEQKIIENKFKFPIKNHINKNTKEIYSGNELENLISRIYNNYHYSNLLFNKKDKLYYRILKKPIEPELFNSFPKPIRFWKSKVEIIIYDENLKILGKTPVIPDEYQIGIYEYSEIFNKNNLIYIKKIPNNDEYISYDIYSIDEKY
ncbi:MAG: protein with domain of unknown function DUF4221 [Algoriphagus marincola HL-49]|uniref:DUF4221 domain-containing protein n=1 Tax=Algoriphagus marincola HL-49 TaxID=1305737 RepID=A0A0P7YBQ5_9BACT|nr:MAG: protein with domain of unknown function DUF4221 [Algoriphagus marincola HL-49]